MLNLSTRSLSDLHAARGASVDGCHRRTAQVQAVEYERLGEKSASPKDVDNRRKIPAGN